jgi:colanic acid/amylovoran biosynthesis glycosyltransferase
VPAPDAPATLEHERITFRAAMRIGYLASHYPAVSHAFVLREIRALRRTGVEVETFSIHRAASDQLLAKADREEAERTYAALPVRPLELIISHLSALARAPERYLATLALALRRANPGLRGRLWGLFYFAETMLVWRAAERRGVRHLHAVFADVASDVALLVTHYGGAEWSWSIAVHGPVEFYDVHLNHLPEKLADVRFAVAISDFGRSQLMALGSDDRWDDMHVVRCGIDPEAFPPPRGRGSGQAEILCVGRLIHFKGQSLLLHALAELRRRGIDARLTLAGTGPKERELELLAGRLGLGDRVRFLGAVGQDRLREVYLAADVFCLPSMAEGLPVVLMEAMAHELPVVTTRIMGIAELVEDGAVGTLVPPGRLDAIVDALEKLLRDPELRARLGREGRRKVLAEFDVNASARRLRDVLTAALQPAT